MGAAPLSFKTSVAAQLLSVCERPRCF